MVSTRLGWYKRGKGLEEGGGLMLLHLSLSLC
jgi:hypothetical protein